MPHLVFSQALPQAVPFAISPQNNAYLFSSDSLSPSSKRIKTLALGGTAFYGLTLSGLYFLWYKEGLSPQFRFFNDNAQWKQMDKVGHFYSAYHFSRASAEAFRWAGLSHKKAMFWGAMAGVMLLAPIEILDGFSPEYGASWGDFVANTSGSAFLWGQALLWNETRLKPKFSFRRTAYAPQRPNVLGNGWQEEWLKDYNGQTYWLSVDVDKFLPESRFPKWLNLALGYGAGSMLYARDDENESLGGLRAYRQYYLAPDWDLTALQPRRKLYKVLLFLLETVRLPGPALEFSRPKGWQWHWLYF
ncbi:MAG: DUF2279 domain-containing protein [Microscillaceae bacterium]|nr:DUF2279 domain-containing protein [Microscillaceae bacterium]